MSISPDLDDARLSQSEFRIYVRICRRWTEERGCFESMTEMAKACLIHTDTVRSAIKKLEKKNMIVRTARPGKTDRFDPLPSGSWKLDSPENEVVPDSRYTENEGGHSPENEGGHSPENGATKGIKEGNKGRDKEGRTSPDPDSEEEEAFAEDSWQLSFANALRSRLAERGVLAKAVDRAAPKKLSSMMQKWADVFDKLHRIDGYAQAEIAEVMRWLVAPDNWWMQTGNFRSGMKLRDKPKSSEETYFDQFIIRMRQEKKAPSKPPVDILAPIPEHDLPRAISEQAARGVHLTIDDFWKKGRDERGTQLYAVFQDRLPEEVTA